jgi:hypothetical protein
MIRRVANGLSPFHGDSDHLHHVLRRLGLSSRKVAQVVLVGAAVSSAIGVGGHYFGMPDGLLFLCWLSAGVIYHVIFGSRLVIGRGQQAPAAANLVPEDGAYITQRRQ